jgi:hypothetical protein
MLSKLTRLRPAQEGRAGAGGESNSAGREAGSIRLEHCFLIHADSDVVIVSDSDDVYAATLVLPRDAVKGVSSPR